MGYLDSVELMPNFIFLCKSAIDDNLHFILDCPSFREKFDLIFSKIADMIRQCCNASVSTFTLNKSLEFRTAVKSSFPFGMSHS